MSTNLDDKVVRSTAWKISNISGNSDSCFYPSSSDLSDLADTDSQRITQVHSLMNQPSPNISLSSNMSDCDGLDISTSSPLTSAETPLSPGTSLEISRAVTIVESTFIPPVTAVESLRAHPSVENPDTAVDSLRAHPSVENTLSPDKSVETIRAHQSAENTLSPDKSVESRSRAVVLVETTLSPNTSVESSRAGTSTSPTTSSLTAVSSVISFTPSQTLFIAKKSMPVCDQPKIDQLVHDLPDLMHDRTIRVQNQPPGSSSNLGQQPDGQNNSAGVPRPFVCEDCGKAFAKAYRLKEHTMMHQPKPCKYCDKVFRSYSGLRDHISSIHDSNRFICLTCNKLFKTVTSLKRHMASNVCERELNIKTIKCPKCEKKFKIKKCLYVHMKKKHPEED